jgi:hypothetical protein
VHGNWNLQSGLPHRNKICGAFLTLLANSTRSCLAAAFALRSPVELQEPFPCVPASTFDAAAALVVASLLGALPAHNRSLALTAPPLARKSSRCSGGVACIAVQPECSVAAMWCSAVQCSAVQCSAPQCSAVQCSAVDAAMRCDSVIAKQHDSMSAVHCTALHCTAVVRWQLAE